MITVHSGWATDFSGMGLCSLTPTECTVEEQAGGLFQLKLTHPMDAGGKWWYLSKYNIIKAPAPMRETPLLNMTIAREEAEGTGASQEIYSVRVNTRLRLRTKPSTSTGRIIGKYVNGTRVIKIGQSGEWLQVVVQSGGATGWMHGDYLVYVETQTLPPASVEKNDGPPVIVQPRQTREQLFRISTVEKDDVNGLVYVTALHVFYDLMGIPIDGKYTPENIKASQAAQIVFQRALKPHTFDVYSDAEGMVTGDYTGRSIVSALTETDGIVTQANARLVRDNFDVFVLQDVERDRGVEVRHGKNLLGAVLTEDVSDVITTVIPVGRDKDGEPLYLSGTTYVDADNAAELPVVRAKSIDYDVKSGSDEYPDDESARAELLRLARLEFSENGINNPAIGLDVDFVALENTRQYADYAALQTVHLYDTVRVISGRSGIDAKARVTGYIYNCMTKRYDIVTLGRLLTLETPVSGYDIASGTVSGNRLVMGSVDGDRLRSMTIQYAKIAQAAIRQLNAEAVTAIIGRFEDIAADKIVTDELYAAFANLINLAAENIKAGSIQTDQLAAALANFVSLTAATADFDLATIQNLLSNALVLEKGVAEKMMITNLVVTSANMLSAVIDKLVVKGEDGQYYRVSVGSDGLVSTEVIEVSDEEIAAGTTGNGQQIVESTINVQDLNAQYIAASEGVINKLLTEALTAGKITAGEALIASATIPALYTTSINAMGETMDLTANSTIQLLIGTNELIRAWYTFTEDGMRVGKAGSTYSTLTDDTGFHVLQLGEKIGSFAKRQLAAETVRVGRVDTPDSRIVLREAPDGGLAILPEVIS